MNLLDESWMPVLRRDGAREWVAPAQLSRPDLVAFAADRADFNGALAQFAIGLLQTTMPVQTGAEWRALFVQAPSAEALAQWFAPYAAAFEFDGEGPRFMQDFGMAADEGRRFGIAALLIDQPGEQGLEQNTDLFVKRASVQRLCDACAAMALFTLQLNAPAGGAGHRTGLRGGGPLSTLLLAPESLWHSLWLNVIENDRFAGDDAAESDDALHLRFPWMADLSVVQRPGGETQPTQTHAAHVFWAMPRRIRLLPPEARSGACDICGRHGEQFWLHYRTRPQGFNYAGPWDHPLTPYYEQKDEWLPLHPQPGGLGYRHWAAWLIGRSSVRKRRRRARVIDHLLTHRTRTVPGALRVWAFGYDMDNMKPRCWYEATVPVYGFADCDLSAQRKVEAEVSRWLEAAEFGVSVLRIAVRSAWFDDPPEGVDLSAVDAAFWSATEPRFYAQLRDLIDCAAEKRAFDDATVNTAWLDHLRKVALRLFDENFVGVGPVAQQKPARTAGAHRQLRANLFGPKLRETLGFRVERPAGAADKPKTRQRRKGAG